MDMTGANLTFTASNPPHVEIYGRHRAVLDHHLRPGETVLYAARPAPWSTYFDGGIAVWFFIVWSLCAVLMGVGGVMMATVIIGIKGFALGPLVLLLGSASFAVVGGALQFELLSSAQSSVHAVTDHRLLTIRAWQPKFVRSIEISSILCLRRTVHGLWGSRDTLTFGTKYIQHNDDDDSLYWYMDTESWCGVPYAGVAHDLIKLRRLACGAHEVPQMPLWAFYGKRTTTPPPA
jgi:hypothetical protein